MMQDILYSFSQFGVVHLAVVVGTVVASVGAVRRRRRLPTEVARLRLDRRIAVFALAVAIVNQVSELLPWRFELYRSLPIHVCDVIGIVAPLAILTGGRVWRAMLYFWGLGLSTQAIFTPELQHGIASFTFWVFWLPHAMIVVLAVYDLAALGFRPGWKDYLLAMATLALYLVLVLPIDLWLSVNYGFVGRGSPGQPSVIDFLGPWPLRLFKLILGVFVFLALMTLPWVIVRRITSRAAGDGGPRGAAEDDVPVAIAGRDRAC